MDNNILVCNLNWNLFFNDVLHDENFVGFVLVRIEEIVDEEKPANENAVSKRSKKKNERNGSSDNNDTQQQIVDKSGPGVQVMESEDEDGFPISSPGKNKNEKLKKKAKDDPSTKSIKRKIDAILQDGDKAR